MKPGSMRDRFHGVLLGTAMGDALGMPVEGAPMDAIQERFGELREMKEARLGRGTVTDDTHMTLALAEALASTPDAVDLDVVADRFAARFRPERGYGGNARVILSEIRSGIPWRDAVERHRLPGGSWANGAAMRVAPVALAFLGRRDRVADAAVAQAKVTGHEHPVGTDGARLQALAVHSAVSLGDPLEPLPFVEELERHGEPWHPEVARALRWVRTHLDAEPEEAARNLGTGARASQSVPAALWAFLSVEGGAQESVVRAVNLGGDTDTVGAMAGALAGAWNGASAFPSSWMEALEGGAMGADGLRAAADALYRTSPGRSDAR